MQSFINTEWFFFTFIFESWSCFSPCPVENYVIHPPAAQEDTDGEEEVIQLRKLNGSPSESPSHQNLHKELLFAHKKWGKDPFQRSVWFWSYTYEKQSEQNT